ncbi:MAG: metal-sensitive transcriptional regulator [Anaerolineaceae bacterium]|nr:metal-sensitive transcriptional regulator [Anaerolineaceae bacterium]
MKIQNPNIKVKLIQRLRRIEGQVRGIQNMLNEERDCREIMQQLTAVSSAVRSTSRTFFQNYAAVCMAEIDEQNPLKSSKIYQAKREQIVKEMISLLDKAP